MCQFLNYAQVNEALFCSDRLTKIHAPRIWHFMPDLTCNRSTWWYLSDVKFRTRDSLIRPLLCQLRNPIIMYILTPVIYIFLIYIWNGGEYFKNRHFKKKNSTCPGHCIYFFYEKWNAKKTCEAKHIIKFCNKM